MEWMIDTGMCGHIGCSPSDLRKVLEAAADHFESTMPDVAVRAVMMSVDRTNLDPTKNPAAGQLNLELAQKCAKATEAVQRRMPIARAQMAACIDVAEQLAKQLEGNVTVTLSGHQSARHPSGVPTRFLVAVDLALPEE
jgi:hypothetical protein